MLPSSEMYERSNFDASISAGILLVEVAHRDDLGMAEQRVRVEVELGVERDHLPSPVTISGLISASDASVSSNAR